MDFPRNQNNSRLKKHQILVSAITFLYFAALHANRTSWGYSKHNLQNDSEFSFTDSDFGWIDLSFLISYAISSFILGWLGDKMDLKVYLIISSFGSGISIVCFSLLKFIKIDNLIPFIIFQSINGVFQSMAWY